MVYGKAKRTACTSSSKAFIYFHLVYISLTILTTALRKTEKHIKVINSITDNSINTARRPYSGISEVILIIDIIRAIPEHIDIPNDPNKDTVLPSPKRMTISENPYASGMANI